MPKKNSLFHFILIVFFFLLITCTTTNSKSDQHLIDSDKPYTSDALDFDNISELQIHDTAVKKEIASNTFDSNYEVKQDSEINQLIGEVTEFAVLNQNSLGNYNKKTFIQVEAHNIENSTQEEILSQHSIETTNAEAPEIPLENGEEANKNFLNNQSKVMQPFKETTEVIGSGKVASTIISEDKFILENNERGKQSMTILYVTIGILFFFLVLILLIFIRTIRKLRKLKERFKDVISIDDEIELVKQKHEKITKKLNSLNDEYKERHSSLSNEYDKKKRIYDQLSNDVSILEDSIELMEYGVYKPFFDFDTSEMFKTQINKIKKEQKQMIKDKTACQCTTEWTVGGKKSEGRKMTNRNIKLMLRAFNGECDSVIGKVKWNNVTNAEARIDKSYEMINKLGEPNHTFLSIEYKKLKLRELYATYEYQEKKHEEKEEQRAIREQMREEEKVQREIEKATEKAEHEEKQYQQALEKAREEISHATGQKFNKLNREIEVLQEKLIEAQQNKERAMSRAQQTKSGHVYVISNIGSFGKDVYKIGLTRRLEPLDRVRELGGASVPFRFDVHAMIYSKDAPTLETKLHNKFKAKRVNLINNRKEFFKVSLEEIEKEVNKEKADIIFTKVAEAREFRKTAALRNENNKKEDIESLQDAI